MNWCNSSCNFSYVPSLEMNLLLLSQKPFHVVSSKCDPIPVRRNNNNSNKIMYAHVYSHVRRVYSVHMSSVEELVVHWDQNSESIHQRILIQHTLNRSWAWKHIRAVNNRRLGRAIGRSQSVVGVDTDQVWRGFLTHCCFAAEEVHLHWSCCLGSAQSLHLPPCSPSAGLRRPWKATKSTNSLVNVLVEMYKKISSFIFQKLLASLPTITEQFLFFSPQDFFFVFPIKVFVHLSTNYETPVWS